MRKLYLLMVALLLVGSNVIAQVKAYQAPAVLLTDEIIAERLAEAKKQGTADWELETYKKGLIQLMKKQQYNLAHPNTRQAAPDVVQAACTNIDFEQGNYSGWTLTSGDINGVSLPCNTCPSSAGGIAAITTTSNSGTTWTNGIDGCSGLSVVAPGGGNNSLCLNDNSSGGKIQKIRQTFSVTASNNVFTYNYLAVLQNAGHTAAEEPYFVSQVLDGSGNVIPCTYVYQHGNAGGTGWNNAAVCSGIYKGWVTVTLDLTSYIGQNCTVEFVVSDCAQGGHFGYCYIDADCNQIQANNVVTICPGSTQLCGPSGFTTYSWSGPVTGNAMCLNTSTAGAYTLVTTGQCPAPTRYYTVNISPTPTVNFTSTVTPCNNTVPFTDQSTISGGATITGYSWDFGDGGTSSTQNPSHAYTGPGTYNVVLTCTSSVGCVGSFTAPVTIGTGPAAVFSANTVCPGGTTTFTNSSTGATGYTWDFGDGSATTTTPSPTHVYAGAGNYVVTLTATGSGTCVATTTVNVVVNPLPTVTATSATTCAGGSASIVGGGASTYTWNTGFVGGTLTASPASTTNYTVTGTDANGCVNTATASITITANPTLTTTPATICAGSTGSIIAANATSYSWSGPNIVGSATSATLSANPATTSTYTVIGSIGSCTTSATEVITVNPMPVPSFVATTECFGTATVFTNNSTPAGSTYNWDFGDGNTSTTPAPAETYPAAGSYVVTLTVTAPGSCVATTTANITVKPIPTLNVVPNVTVCDQQQIVVQPFVSVPAGATTAWNNSTTSIGLAANGAGNINPFTGSSNGSPTAVSGTVTAVPSLNGCVGPPINFVLTVSPQPTITLTSPPFTCPGQVVPAPTYTLIPNDPSTVFSWTNNNTATGMGSSGTGDPSTYTFTAASNATLANISGIVTVTPTLGTCVGPPATYTVTIYPTPVINPVANVEKCPNTAIPAINLTVLPGGGTPSFAWSNSNPGIGLAASGTVTPIPGFTGINNGSTQQIANISVGASLNGCPAVPVPFTITIDPNPTAAFNANHLICVGSAMNFSDQSTIGSGYIAGWSWNLDATGAFAATQNPTYTIPTAGTHSVTLTATSDKGCTNTVTHTVYVNYIPTANYTGSGQGCATYTLVGSTFSDQSSVTGPAQISNWNWNFGNGASCNTQAVPGILSFGNPSPTTNAVYTVSLIVTTDSGCVSQAYSQPRVTVWPHPLPGFSFGPSDPGPDINNPTVYFFDQSQGASGPSGLTWNLGDVFLNNQQNNYTNVQNPVHVYENYDPYTYYVTQWVSNIYGCKDSITKPVEIIPSWTFYIPNAFSPNGDGINEGFKGTGVGIDTTTYNLWIFDRWGQMIFYTNDMEKVWDGRIMGKSGDVVQEDVYVWKVKFHDFLGKRHEYKGTVSVIK